MTNTDEEIDFFTDPNRGVPAEVFREAVGVDHDGGLLDRASPEKHVKDLFGASGEEFLAGFLAIFVDQITLRTENDHGGVGLEGFQLKSQTIWVHDVIGVHAGDPFGTGHFYGSVGADGTAEVFGIS